MRAATLYTNLHVCSAPVCDHSAHWLPLYGHPRQSCEGRLPLSLCTQHPTSLVPNRSLALNSGALLSVATCTRLYLLTTRNELCMRSKEHEGPAAEGSSAPALAAPGAPSSRVALPSWRQLATESSRHAGLPLLELGAASVCSLATLPRALNLTHDDAVEHEGIWHPRRWIRPAP